jgi:hypothetical protein
MVHTPVCDAREAVHNETVQGFGALTAHGFLSRPTTLSPIWLSMSRCRETPKLRKVLPD